MSGASSFVHPSVSINSSGTAPYVNGSIRTNSNIDGGGHLATAFGSASVSALTLAGFPDGVGELISSIETLREKFFTPRKHFKRHKRRLPLAELVGESLCIHDAKSDGKVVDYIENWVDQIRTLFLHREQVDRASTG
jgi:hypothetical protein